MTSCTCIDSEFETGSSCRHFTKKKGLTGTHRFQIKFCFIQSHLFQSSFVFLDIPQVLCRPLNFADFPYDANINRNFPTSIPQTKKCNCQCYDLHHYMFIHNGMQGDVMDKRKFIYLKTQSVPRCKHFSSRL